MTMQRVLMALVVSFASFILIFGLDTLHDMDLTDRVAEAAIRKVRSNACNKYFIQYRWG